MDTAQIQYLIILVSLAFFSILILLVSLVFYVSKRKAQFIIEREKANLEFEKQLVETRIEITEQNLKNMSWELHDNIGQLLTVANLELEMMYAQKEQWNAQSFSEIKKTIKLCLEQVRSISKSLNSDIIHQLGLISALDHEVSRLTRLGLIDIALHAPDQLSIDNKTEIVIFRMIQEFITNTLKHANATKLSIDINENDAFLKITVSDNGCGFDLENHKKNVGLLNLHSRSELIGAQFDISSAINQGTTMSISIKSKD